MSASTTPAIQTKPVPTFKGAYGETLTVADLPPKNTRWTIHRKCVLMNAIHAGIITTEEALARYDLSVEELELWTTAVARHGLSGLRVTHLKEYQEADRAHA